MFEHGLKLKPSKCELSKQSVTYLGHVISEKGIATDPEKLSAVRDWPAPTNIKQLRQFLGFAGYYRRFIKNFARIVAPLNALLKGHGTNTKKKGNKGKSKPTNWTWAGPEEESFHAIKQKLLQPPILGYANYKLPFVLHTDASSTGLGAVLYQVQEGKKRVIAYASRGLRQAEKNYPAHKLEFLALKWSVCDKFHDYLYGTQFQVVTDNNPLTYVLSKAKLDATSQRWIAALASFNFSISYRSGQKNGDADGLSRMPAIFHEEVKAICQAMTCSLPHCNSLTAESIPYTAGMELDDPVQCSQVDWQVEQRKDKVISRVIELKDKGFRPHKRNMKREPMAVQRYFREWKRLQLVEGVLYRITVIDGERRKQLVVPEVYREVAFLGIHRDTGHPGKEKTLWLARQRYFWPSLEKEVNERIERCPRCIRSKTPIEPTAELFPVETTHPLELVCIDFLGLERSKGGFENILVITDHFTRFSQAIPCKNQTATTTSKALYENFFLHYGFPEKLHSDQGRNFESKVLKELCKVVGIKKTRTTPYHPMGNGSAERFNKTLIKMLSTLENDQKADWKSHVAPLVQAYNATKSEATGYAPHYLMFGWNPRLPIDCFLGVDPGNEKDQTHSGYASKLQKRLETAHRIAADEARKVKRKNKERYDAKVKEVKLEVGDRVLVRNVGLKGKNKLADKWDEEIYRVVSQRPGLPVYKVKGEVGGKIRTLHRNMLLSYCGISEGKNTEDSEKRRKRGTKRTGSAKDVAYQSSSPSSSDSEEDRIAISRRTRSTVPKDKIVQNESTEDSYNCPLQDDDPVLDESQEISHGRSVGEDPVSENEEEALTEDIVSEPTEHTSGNQHDTNQSEEPQVPVYRRSTRHKKPPDRYGEWMT